VLWTSGQSESRLSNALRRLTVIQANEYLENIPKHDRRSLAVQGSGEEELDESASVSDYPTDPYPQTLSIIFTCKSFGKY
jgi:hypothetical protein